MPEGSYTHFDPQALLHDLFDNKAVVASVLGAFADWHDSAQADLQAAASAGDALALARVTHSVRGTLAQLHSGNAVEIAQRIESRCKQDGSVYRPTEADVAPLKHELKAVLAEVKTYLAD
jgi:HPt (histidine-containing phosphotransfer) domain-containing protein